MRLELPPGTRGQWLWGWSARGGRSPLTPELYLGPSKPSLGDARPMLLPGDRLQTPGLPQGTSPALSLHRPSDLRAHKGQGSPELGGGTD